MKKKLSRNLDAARQHLGEERHRGTLQSLRPRGAENIQQMVKPHAAALREKIERLNHKLSEIQIGVDVDTEPPRSDLIVGSDGWLFDSRRDYLTQLEWYRSGGR